MGHYEDILKEAMTYYQELAQKYMDDLKNSPPGSLLVQHCYGKDQFLQSLHENGVRIRRGITGNENVLRALARKEFARRALNIIEHNLEIINDAAKELIPFDPDAILGSMRAAYKKLPEDYFFDREELVITHHLDDEATARIRRHAEWGKQPYKQTDYYAEFRRIRTSHGLYVRSKSEALIAENLYRYGIAFHYDEEMQFGDFKTAPDFTFEDADGRLFFWEHMGMMDKEDYATRNFRKLAGYRANGVLPGGRLLLSFDGDGTINMGMVDAIIQNEVIPRL